MRLLYMGKFSWVPMVLLWNASCLFQPDETLNYKDVNANVAQIEIVTNLKQDTITLYGPLEFEYEIQGADSNKEYYASISINGRTQSSKNLSSSLILDHDLSPGYYKGAFYVITNSGTNSISDRLGFERIVDKLEWVFHIDTGAPTEFTISSIANINGSLKIEWKKYDRTHFISYTIKKYKSDGSLVDQKTITDQNQNYYFDNSYVGGEFKYAVFTENAFGSTGSGLMTYEDTNIPTIISYELVENINLKVNYSESRYFNNVARIEVYESLSPDSFIKFPPIFSTNNSSESSFTFAPSFGEPRHLRVRTIGKVSEGQEESETRVTSLPFEYVFGEKIEAYSKILFAPSMNRYYTISNNLIKSFNDDSNQSISTNSLPGEMRSVQVSPDENFILGIRNENYYIWNASDLVLVEQRNLSDLLSAGQTFSGIGMKDSDNLLLNKMSSTTGRLLIYNRSSQSVTNEYTGMGAAQYLELSGDENYLISTGGSFSRVFNIGTSTLSNVYTGNPGAPVYFDPMNDNQIIIGTTYEAIGGSILLWDLAAKTHVGSINTPPIRVTSLDVSTGVVLGNNQLAMLAYDYINDKILYNSISSGLLTTKGNYLYSNLGTRLKLRE